MAAALALAGCTAIFEAPSHAPDSYESVQIYYRQLAVNAVRPFVGAAEIEIAELKPSVAPQPGDWSTCARVWKNGRAEYYSVFIRGRTVTDMRGSTLIDRCDGAHFSPFEMAVYRR